MRLLKYIFFTNEDKALVFKILKGKLVNKFSEDYSTTLNIKLIDNQILYKFFGGEKSFVKSESSNKNSKEIEFYQQNLSLIENSNNDAVNSDAMQFNFESNLIKICYIILGIYFFTLFYIFYYDYLIH